jgi:hypothetical protein
MTNADRPASGVWHIGFCESEGYDGQTESAGRELYDWVLAGRSNPARIQMALDRWYQARWESVMEDPHKRTIDGKDVIDILFERRENKASSAHF